MDMSGKTIDSVLVVFGGLILGGALLASGLIGAGYALALAAGLSESASMLAGLGCLFTVCGAALAGAEIHDRRQQKKWAAERKAREETAKQLMQGLPAAIPAPGKLHFAAKLGEQFPGGAKEPVNSDASPTAPATTVIQVWKGNNRP